jgi:hypothetical protein
MKAVNNNGVITFYQSVPKSFRSSTGLHLNVQNWSEQDMKDNGLFDVIIEDGFDSRIHDLGEIYFDSASSVFRKDKVDKTWSKSLADLKSEQINNFKSQIGSKLAATDWYIIRNVDSGVEVPSDITDARAALRTQSDTVENEINDLTTKAAVMSYDFPNID